MTRDLKDEIKQHEEDILATVKAMGGCAQRYRRERKKQFKAVVSEIYSPPRITAMSKLLLELNVVPSFAFDLTTSGGDGRLCDFDEKEMRDRAIRRAREDKPMLLIGSPMCTAFSV